MKILKIIIVGLLFSFCTFLLLSIDKPQSDYTNIGDVKYSVLPINLFMETQKGTWVLLDGKPLSEETELYQLLESKMQLDILPKKGNIYTVPDARGRFVRGLNINGQGDDPDNRTPGAYQVDAFQGHKHINSNNIAQLRGKQTNNTPHQRYTVTETAATNSAGSINGGYGTPRIAKETRPKNIALYTYIKIAN